MSKLDFIPVQKQNANSVFDKLNNLTKHNISNLYESYHEKRIELNNDNNIRLSFQEYLNYDIESNKVLLDEWINQQLQYSLKLTDIEQMCIIYYTKDSNILLLNRTNISEHFVSARKDNIFNNIWNHFGSSDDDSIEVLLQFVEQFRETLRLIIENSIPLPVDILLFRGQMSSNIPDFNIFKSTSANVDNALLFTVDRKSHELSLKDRMEKGHLFCIVAKKGVKCLPIFIRHPSIQLEEEVLLSGTVRTITDNPIVVEFRILDGRNKLTQVNSQLLEIV